MELVLGPSSSFIIIFKQKTFDNINFDFIKNVAIGLFIFFFIFQLMFSLQTFFLLLFNLK